MKMKKKNKIKKDQKEIKTTNKSKFLKFKQRRHIKLQTSRK